MSKSFYIILDVREYKHGRGIYEGESISIYIVGIFFLWLATLLVGHDVVHMCLS